MQNIHSSIQNAKETRINVRINSEQKAVIALAAQLQHTTISHFVIENAYQTASQLVGELTHLQMDPKQYAQFCHKLDAVPAKNLKAMQKLLNEKGVLDV